MIIKLLILFTVAIPIAIVIARTVASIKESRFGYSFLVEKTLADDENHRGNLSSEKSTRYNCGFWNYPYLVNVVVQALFMDPESV